jgi:aminoglycoside phosphotransferase (APT) family kinase protein
MRATDVVLYLIDASLLDRSHVLEPGFEVISSPRRNNNFQVVNPAGTSVMVKQATSVDRALTLAREAAAYRAFEALPPRHTRPWRPDCLHYDGTAGILVLRLETGAQTVKHRVRRSGKVSRHIASALGGALAQLHAVPAAGHRAPRPDPDGPPWILYLECPDAGVLETSSGAALEMIRIFQSSELACDVLREHRMTWRSDTFVHGDLRWENCLVTGSGPRPGVRLVDWELSGAGDAAWDLGCVLAGYLRLWLDSVPIASESALVQAVEAARFPLTDVQPCTRSLWATYTARRPPNVEPAGRLVIRSVAFAGVVLLQSVYEEAQNASVFPPHLAYRLQLAFNVMARPLESAVHLFDLPLDAS